MITWKFSGRIYCTVIRVWTDVFEHKFRENISTFSDLFEKNVEIFLCPVGTTVNLEIARDVDFDVNSLCNH